MGENERKSNSPIADSARSSRSRSPFFDTSPILVTSRLMALLARSLTLRIDGQRRGDFTSECRKIRFARCELVRNVVLGVDDMRGEVLRLLLLVLVRKRRGLCEVWVRREGLRVVGKVREGGELLPLVGVLRGR